VYLTHIMNGCFKYSYFPTAWKQENVIPNLKPGKDPSDPKSYRPISRKVIVASYEISFGRASNICILMNNLTQLIRVTRHIASGLAAKLSTGMLLLLHKLLEYRFPT
jgi:hypothetical protein